MAHKNRNSFTWIKQKFWQVLTIGLLTIGILSCILNAEAKTWWGLSKFDVEVSQIINQTHNPLVISDAYIGQIMPLTYQLNPTAKFLLVRQPDFPQFDHPQNPVFLFNPSDWLKTEFNQQNIAIELVYEFRVNSFSIPLFRVKI